MWSGARYHEFQKIYQFRNGKDLMDRLEAARSLAGTRILDIGCGEGSLTRLLAEHSKGSITAVDSNSSMLKMLAEHNALPNIALVESDLFDFLEACNSTFDIVYSNAVLHWLKNLEELSRFLMLSRQRLVVDGTLAIRFSLSRNAQDVKKFLSDSLQEFFIARDGFEMRTSPFSHDQVMTLLSDSGFNILVAEEIEYMPFQEDEMDFEFMIASQPIHDFVSAEELNPFIRYLKLKWEKVLLKVESHHGLYVASR